MMAGHSKILYLTYDGLTDPLGQSQILPYLIGLSRHEYHISIISAEKKENFSKRKQLIEDLIKEENISWHPFFYTKKPPIFSTLWDINQMQRLAVQLHKMHGFPLVHCRSYITALTGLQLKKTLGVKFVFDMRGFWADERVEGGLWNLRNPVFKTVFRYFKSKERQFLQQADYTISLTHQAKQIIHSRPGLHSIPIQVIPCCVDTTLFKASQQEIQTAAASKNSFTLSYLGSLGTWYMLDEMLQLFKRLLLQKPEAVFLFVTPDDPAIILEKAVALDIPQKQLKITKAERREVPLLLAQSQMSVFFIKPSYSKQASSPTKMGEILSMGIPVICNAGVGDTDFLFAEYKAGILVKELNSNSYDEAVGKIDAALQIPPQQLRQIACNYFDLQKGVDLYKSVYKNLLS